MLSRIKEIALGRNTMQFTFLVFVIIYGAVMEIPGLRTYYLFPSLFEQKPLYWWPVRTQVVMFALIGFNLFLYILSRTRGRTLVPYWAEMLFGAGLLAMVTAIAVDTTSGVAVYDNRAESSILTFAGYQKENIPFEDARSVDLGCKVVATRGAETTQVFFSVHGEHGAIIDLGQGLNKRAPDAYWLKAIAVVDNALPSMTVPRQLVLRPDSVGLYKNCVSKFRDAQSEGDKPVVTGIFERPDIVGLM